MQAGDEAEARVLTQQADLMRKVRRWKQLDAVRRAHKGSFVGVVNFGLAGGYCDAQFAADMTGLAPNFKPGALPGLLSKVLAPEPATSLSPARTVGVLLHTHSVLTAGGWMQRWLAPAHTAKYGGVYLWEDGAQAPPTRPANTRGLISAAQRRRSTISRTRPRCRGRAPSR